MSSKNFDFNSMTDEQINTVLSTYSLNLKPAEAQQIQSLLNRPPTLSECVLWSIQGSEHCSYKSSKHHLKQLPTHAPHVVSGAQEDAGIVRIATDNQGKHYCLAISHESHNHPSQVVPFEGAATGIGGNVRDISCMGATVIANADSLRFGTPNLKTQWLQQGVVEGIASYSNSIGVPNLIGDIGYHPLYQDNCLVTVVSLGLIEEQAITHSYVPDNASGHALILVGKPTDNSGFGGASFASSNLNESDKANNRGAVQEPNAFLGRLLLQANAALVQQLDQDNLINQVGFKDLGAGGIACASVEIAESANLGAVVYIEKVHTSIDNLEPTVILCAETQERYLWACPQNLVDVILHHYNNVFDLPNVSNGARAAVIGHIQKEPNYEVYFREQCLIHAKAKDITTGILYDRPIKVPKKKLPVTIEKKHSLKNLWTLIQNDPNLQSDYPIYKQYDKQVQGRTHLERGQADAGVLQPFNSPNFPEEIHSTGIALAVADNPFLGVINPFYAAQHAVVHAMYKVTAVGAEPWAITDCLCFGNPEIPEQMWELTESIRGIKSACETITLTSYPEHPTPIVAGNVSLYNQSEDTSIPPSPIISCSGKTNSIKHIVNWSLKKSGNYLYAIQDETLAMAGSLYAQHQACEHLTLPPLNLLKCRANIRAILHFIHNERIESTKVIEQGGIVFAIQCMSELNHLGASLTMTEPQSLFLESLGFLIEVMPNNCSFIENYCKKHDLKQRCIGHVIEDHCLKTPSHTLYFSEKKYE